jgi:hypothetical protein
VVIQSRFWIPGSRALRSSPSSSRSNPVAVPPSAHPSRQTAPVGTLSGTLETITFHVGSERRRASVSQARCVAPSMVFDRAAVSAAAFASRYCLVSRRKSSR